MEADWSFSGAYARPLFTSYELESAATLVVLISEMGKGAVDWLMAKKPLRPSKRIRILVAKPGLDGHDRGALVLCRAFRDAGMEVIYTGFLATPEQVAQMAIDEDVDVVAMSLLNGAHMTAFPKVAKLIREKGGNDILLVGGGIIPDEDKPLLEKHGITGNFGPGTSLKTIIDHVERVVKERDAKKTR